MQLKETGTDLKGYEMQLTHAQKVSGVDPRDYLRMRGQQKVAEWNDDIKYY